MSEAYLEPRQTSKIKPSEAVIQSYSVEWCFQKFRKIHRKKPVPGLELYLKRDSETDVLL